MVLRDGHTVRVRPIIPEDAERLVRFHARQSPESIYLRYFSPRPELSEKDLRHFTHVDHHDRVAFVALAEDELIAVSRYERYRGTDTAEVAFFVDDANNGRGLAGLMLEYLAAAARERGVRRFAASTLPHNRKMLSVFRHAGFDVASRVEDGVVELSFPIDPTDASVAAFERRERAAESASVRPLLEPSSVAVIGVGRDGGVGAVIYDHLLRYGFTGELHRVNFRAADDGWVQRIEDLPDGVELAVVATPASSVIDVLDACGERSIRTAVVVSAGFATADQDGQALQRAARDVARRYGMRLLGPASSGVLNTDPAVRLNATIAPNMPVEGTVGILTDAGTLSVAIIEHAARTELGVSSLVATGNRADVSATDLLSYWSTDDRTNGILLYVGGQRLRPRFVRAARATSLHKPVAALHSVNPVGAIRTRAARAGDRRARAMFRQTGIIPVDTLQELFDIGRVVADQPVPAGAGVAVVGNSDGAVALAAASCQREGLQVAAVEAHLGGAAIANPIDLGYGATAADLAGVLDQVGDAPDVHSVLVVWAPPLFERDQQIEAVILAASAARPDLTVVVTMLDADDRPRILGDDHCGLAVPTFGFPEAAARALGRLAGYSDWRRSAQPGSSTGADPGLAQPARAVVERALAGRSDDAASVALDHSEQDELLAAAGVQVIPRTVVLRRGDAERAATALGWPVALKAAHRDRSARSVASGVVLDLGDAAALESTWERMEAMLGEAMHPVVAQRFVDGGVDVAVTVRREGDGAATIEVGMGGPASVTGETELGVLPLSLSDAATLVAASPVGRAVPDPLDRVPVVELVHRLANLATEIAEIELLKVDPVVCSPAAALVADAEVVVGETPDELDVRRLD